MNRRAQAEAERQKVVQESIALEEKLLEAEEGLEKANALLKRQRMCKRQGLVDDLEALILRGIVVFVAGVETEKVQAEVQRLTSEIGEKTSAAAQLQAQFDAANASATEVWGLDWVGLDWQRVLTLPTYYITPRLQRDCDNDWQRPRAYCMLEAPTHT
jgi:hypothetical protein